MIGKNVLSVETKYKCVTPRKAQGGTHILLANVSLLISCYRLALPLDLSKLQKKKITTPGPKLQISPLFPNACRDYSLSS